MNIRSALLTSLLGMPIVGGLLPAADPLPKGAIARLVPTPVEVRQVPKGDGPGEVVNLAFSPGGKRLAVGYYSFHPAVIFDAATGKELLKPEDVTVDLSAFRAQPQVRHVSGSLGVAFINGGKEVLTNSSGLFARWDATTGKSSFHSALFTPRAFLPLDGGKRLLVHGNWKELHPPHFLVVDPPTWKLDRVVGKYDARVDGLEISPDGKRLVAYATHGGYEPPPATLWDFEAGKELTKLVGHTAGVREARFTPDGKYLVTASTDTTVVVWQAADGKRVRTIGTPLKWVSGEVWRPGYLCLDVSPAGKLAAGGTNKGDVVVWNFEGGREVLRLKVGENGHQKMVQAVAFSPDGRRLATGGAEGSVLVWDLAALGLVKP